MVHDRDQVTGIGCRAYNAPMSIKIGLMGFGRIGRNLFRIVEQDPRFRIAAVSDIADPQGLLYLARFDTFLGRYPGHATLEGGEFVTERSRFPLLAARDPGDVDWRAYDVDYVIEATGKVRTRAEVARHLEQGAKRVVTCAPLSDAPDISVVYGVNDGQLGAAHRVISNASCTAHAAAPVLATLDQAFGIERAYLSVVHAYTSVGRLADVPADELRLSRAAAENIVPADTKVARLLGEVLPTLAGKVEAAALRVPLPNGSLVDMTIWLNASATREQVNAALRAAADGRFRGLLEYLEDPIVSSDVARSPFSSTFDALATMVLGERMIKTIAWFDNSWAYSHRALDLLARLAKLDGKVAA